MTKSVHPHVGVLLDSLQVIVKRIPSTQAEFMDNEILQDATLMRIQESGEQLVRIRDDFPEYYDKHHSESWHKLIGLRNIISHGYLQVDMDKVWEIATTNIPGIIKELNRLLPE